MITIFDLNVSMIGIPAIAHVGSVSASGFTVSFAPTTIDRSVSSIESASSSIPSTMSYGTFASASSTFMCPGRRPATGWMSKSTVLPRLRRISQIAAIACCPRATARP